MTYETFEELWNTVDDIEQELNEDYPGGMPLETRLALIRNPNLQYCIANHLV